MWQLWPGGRFCGPGDSFHWQVDAALEGPDGHSPTLDWFLVDENLARPEPPGTPAIAYLVGVCGGDCGLCPVRDLVPTGLCHHQLPLTV